AGSAGVGVPPAASDRHLMAIDESQDPKLAALIASIRRRGKPGVWSKGGEVARAGGGTVEVRAAEGRGVRGRAPGRVVAPTAVLYPTENETECDCPSRISPCEHVAAAAIALSNAEAGGGDAPAAPAVQRSAAARVGYRFERADGGLRLAR